MVAVQTENADFSIFEIVSSNPVEIGHAVSWQGDTPAGHGSIVNHTTGETFNVYFQNHWVGKNQLNQQLLRRVAICQVCGPEQEQMESEDHTMASDGKQLETLVAFIEKTLLPQGFE